MPRFCLHHLRSWRQQQWHLKLCRHPQRRSPVHGDTPPHLCRPLQEELHKIIEQYQSHGFQTRWHCAVIPQTEPTIQRPPRRLAYASQLVAYIKDQFPQFEIGVGGYYRKTSSQHAVRGHSKPEKENRRGADFITTQLFYHSNYFRYVDACRKVDIDCPIVTRLDDPHEKVERFCQFCRAELPNLRKAMSQALGDADDPSRCPRLDL